MYIKPTTKHKGYLWKHSHVQTYGCFQLCRRKCKRNVECEKDAYDQYV